jgi:hypothetical protein
VTVQPMMDACTAMWAAAIEQIASDRFKLA